MTKEIPSPQALDAVLRTGTSGATCAKVSCTFRLVWFAVQWDLFGNAAETDSGVSWKVQGRFSPRELVQFDYNNTFIKLFFFFFPHNSPDTP